MITKYELRECKHLKMEISELREQISELVSMMTAPRISRLTGMPAICLGCAFQVVYIFAFDKPEEKSGNV